MQKYWGLRSHSMHAAVWAVSCVAIMIFGYNQAAAGGALAMENFQRQFPDMDTIDTTGQQQKHNATIQGKEPSVICNHTSNCSQVPSSVYTP